MLIICYLHGYELVGTTPTAAVGGYEGVVIRRRRVLMDLRKLHGHEVFSNNENVVRSGRYVVSLLYKIVLNAEIKLPLLRYSCLDK
jgi:hypothetical protein